MPRKTDCTPDPMSDYATIRLTHHVLSRDRAESLRRRPGPRSRQPECSLVGHAWTDDPGREGGTICMACQVVRWP